MGGEQGEGRAAASFEQTLLLAGSIYLLLQTYE